MKIIVNPAYEHLRKFVESIPDIFESEGRVIYSGRNLIKVMTVDDGLEINIKRYGVPALVNRIAYSFFVPRKEGAPFHIPTYCFREALRPRFLSLISKNVSGA